jgi:hypothetical protein
MAPVPGAPREAALGVLTYSQRVIIKTLGAPTLSAPRRWPGSRWMPNVTVTNDTSQWRSRPQHRRDHGPVPVRAQRRHQLHRPRPGARIRSRQVRPRPQPGQRRLRCVETPNALRTGDPVYRPENSATEILASKGLGTRRRMTTHWPAGEQPLMCDGWAPDSCYFNGLFLSWQLTHLPVSELPWPGAGGSG